MKKEELKKYVIEHTDDTIPNVASLLRAVFPSAESDNEIVSNLCEIIRDQHACEIASDAIRKR